MRPCARSWRGPGSSRTSRGAYDSPQTTVDGWSGAIPGLVWLDGGQVAAFAGPGPLVTDDRPLPEYFLLRRTFGEQSPLVTPQSLAEAGFPFR